MATARIPGKVAIVQIAAPERTVLLVEVALDGETLTIADDGDHLPMTDDIREAARRLLESVRTHYGSRTAVHSGIGAASNPGVPPGD